MSALRKCQEYVRTRVLPEGHVERIHAKQALEQEYERCHRIEQFWRRRLPDRYTPRLDSEEKIVYMANLVCDALGIPRVRVRCNVSEVFQSGADAWCRYGKIDTIEIAGSVFGFSGLVHEITHHCGVSGHGQQFCEMLNTIFALLYEYFTGKPPPSDWEAKALAL